MTGAYPIVNGCKEGAAHKVRITEEGLVEESICVPPESTLLRLDRSLGDIRI